MAPEVKRVTFGNVSGSIYDFIETGDTLPMHSHKTYDNHITIVARGSFRAHGDGWDIVVKAGDVLDWQVGQRHEMIALEPSSRFINIIKGQ